MSRSLGVIFPSASACCCWRFCLRFVPQIVMWPLLLILVVGGLLSVSFDAIKQLAEFKRRKP